MQLEGRAGGSALHAPGDRADPLAALLAGTFRDPENGQPVAIQTRSLVIAKSLAGAERELVDQLGFGRRLAVVSDATTHDVLGARVERALAGRYDVASVVLPSGPHPDEATVAALRKETARADALIAVGSGTLNDLCKFASAADGKPYAVFATAPSMNGYVSLNAAITEHGHKKSLPAQAPRGAFFDLKILSAAPARMIRSGVGDGLCRPTSQADWLLAHLLLDTPYRELPYALLEADEPALLDSVEALMAGDAEAMDRLVRVLVLSGLGTAIYGSSLPASQGEHLISHYIDMFAPADRAFVFHGEQVGVTTLSMVRLQERMLEGPPPMLREDTTSEAVFVSRYGDEIGRSCWQEFEQKRLDVKKADSLNHRLAADWDRIRSRIAAVSAPSAFLERVLKRISAPTTPEEISCERRFYEEAIKRSREIRNRCTFLDLAANSGVLERLAPAL
jgi:glycerol-1-phosphate dehydrogenase [NAD(P)+]